MQFITSLSCLLFSWSFIAIGVEFVAPVLKERPVVEPEETLNILINHDTIMMIITLFCAAVFIMVMYGRWLKVKLAFQATTKQSFIDSLLANTREAIWIADKDREIEKINTAYSDLFGLEEDEIVGKCFKVYNDEGRNYEVENIIWQEVVKTGFWHGELWTYNKDNQRISIDMSVTRVATSQKVTGQVEVKYVGMMFDVTDRKHNEQALHQLATRDQLTDLPNRTLFIEYIKHSISTIQPSLPHIAVAFIDIDNFKKVNSSIGLLEGDEIISMVAVRLEKQLDSSISIARLGGDEFALLVPNVLCGSNPIVYIEKVILDVQLCFKQTFRIADQEVNLTTSIGVAIYPTHGTKADALMRCADTALNRVKISGRNDALIFDHVMDDITSDDLNIESELVGALNNNELSIHYQPLFHSKEERIYGFEALVRWNSKTRGLVPPGHFIEIAEQNGLIRQVDFFVLKEAFSAAQRWYDKGLMRGRIAVNISSVNFQQAEFVCQIKELVASINGNCKLIELELTETAMMIDAPTVAKNISILKSMGFTIALDDFGTGFSSLGHLKQFDIDKVKIDRSFIHEIEFNEQDRNITSVIIQLAGHLNIDVVGEGVENEQQAYLLHVMGCHHLQGYLFSRPLPEPQLMEYLKELPKTLPNVSQRMNIGR
ncbi:putative bifunctional diguanylate cyclase/phosphodiesterase [Psychrosphaera haliotis]|uniref:EAL domain-containing protein n=1 Tax=Psychrosphaera haliotis TaxID=555083 RepID=A0A6N8FBZ6_9GAMM|nr:EAL domain-containing protein [Psychrosphaera haliotis]MUH72677.1 EAL domain-containing protein [Psychrosphaera haliotis]